MWLTDPDEIEKAMLEEAQGMSDEVVEKMDSMFTSALRERGLSVPSDGLAQDNTPIAASARSAGQPPVSPAPSLSSGESSAVEKVPVVASEGE